MNEAVLAKETRDKTIERLKKELINLENNKKIQLTKARFSVDGDFAVTVTRANIIQATC